MAYMKSPKRKHVFTKVDNPRPRTSGHNPIVKVIGAKLVLQKGKPNDRQMRIAKCLVGDETRSILFTARNNQDVPEVYVHQFWESIHKYEKSYMFRMDKKKKFNLNLEIFKDIFQICPRVHGQNFKELPTNEDIVYFFKELVHTGKPR
uniref:Single-stranded DNA binding protein Ssb-like OB fold domain-containing protein n=1 Tax=Tanacetum cinerariifolium TaxID=118510 RepID=A0A699H0V8_TANCI|nr:hypothetical protein [Tanacetum cinerariifolium]